VFPVRERVILHPYSDAADLAGVRVPSYDLLETAAEKMRALAGQAALRNLPRHLRSGTVG